MKKKGKKRVLTYQDMEHLCEYLYTHVRHLSNSTNGDKCFAAICYDLHQKASKQIIGIVKPSYKLKLKPHEKYALMHIRAEVNPNPPTDQDNAVVRLLMQNNGK